MALGKPLGIKIARHVYGNKGTEETEREVLILTGHEGHRKKGDI